MPRMLLMIAALSTAAACAADARPSNTYAPAAVENERSVQCAIRRTPTRQGVRFEAVAQTTDAASGDYEFIVTKNDANGSSDISQGGAFDMTAGASEVLGSAELGLERNARYRARLVLRDGSGVLCRRERRS